MNTNSSHQENHYADWLRLETIIKSSGHSIAGFARHIGLPDAGPLIRIKEGTGRIDQNLAETVNRSYPEYRVAWLLSGDVFYNVSEDPEEIEIGDDKIKRIPVYTVFGNGSSPTSYMYASESLVNGAHFAVINRDESLLPCVPVGALVFVAPAEDSSSDKLYLIRTSDHTLIRKITDTDHPEEVRLEAVNRNDYDDLILPRKKIESLYTVEKIMGDL